MPRKQCPQCNGAGWYDVEKERFCGRCMGTGREYDRSKCLSCRGKGSETYKIREVCGECHGSGSVTY